MNVLDNNVNYKSSCPWQYVRDTDTGEWQPQLLQIREKWCATCCIDLTQSNASHLVINPRGQCSEIRANMQCNNHVRRIVVGYTCVYALSIPTGKRNEDQGPLVNNKLTSKTTSPATQTQYVPTTLNKKHPSTKSEKENEKNEGDFNKEQNDKYSTVLHQHVLPPFLGTEQFKQPPFLENNIGQFRPGFLNGMNSQAGQPPIMPMFTMYRNIENNDRSVKTDKKESNEDGEVDTDVSGRSDNDIDQHELEEVQEQLAFTKNIKEPLR